MRNLALCCVLASLVLTGCEQKNGPTIVGDIGKPDEKAPMSAPDNKMTKPPTTTPQVTPTTPGTVKQTSPQGTSETKHYETPDEVMARINKAKSQGTDEALASLGVELYPGSTTPAGWKPVIGIPDPATKEIHYVATRESNDDLVKIRDFFTGAVKAESTTTRPSSFFMLGKTKGGQDVIIKCDPKEGGKGFRYTVDVKK